MFRRIFYKVMKDELETFRSIIQKMINTSIPDIIKLDNRSQYLIVMKDESTAKDLVSHLNDTFDTNNMPRIVVLAAKDVRIIEINKG